MLALHRLLLVCCFAGSGCVLETSDARPSSTPVAPPIVTVVEAPTAVPAVTRRDDVSLERVTSETTLASPPPADTADPH